MAPSALPTDVAASLLKRGYEPLVANGRIFYCRLESTTGTAFQQRVCLSAEQIAALNKDTAETVDLLQRTHAIDCGGGQGKCKR